MVNSNGIDTPMDPKNKLSKTMSPTTPLERKEMEKIPYREAVGSMLWIANRRRPDVSYAVSQVARYMVDPGM